MGTEGDTDRGRLFGFETQHIFLLAIGTRNTPEAFSARALLASIGFDLEGKDNKIALLIASVGWGSTPPFPYACRKRWGETPPYRGGLPSR